VRPVRNSRVEADFEEPQQEPATSGLPKNVDPEQAVNHLEPDEGGQDGKGPRSSLAPMADRFGNRLHKLALQRQREDLSNRDTWCRPQHKQRGVDAVAVRVDDGFRTENYDSPAGLRSAPGTQSPVSSPGERAMPSRARAWRGPVRCYS
jgi:hypothetical protein